MPSSSPALTRRRLALAAAVAAVLAWLAWAQLPGRGLLAPGAPPTGEAEWIWIDGTPTRRSAVAFYAARDVRLAAPAPAAELMVAADEEYHAFVNGRRVGSGAWRPGATVDRYAVGELLRRGVNRLVIEVRSGRGTGGLLACLLDRASGRVLAATDREWRTITHHPDGLFRGWLPIDYAPHAHSWGLPPTGRWGIPGPGPLRRPEPDTERRQAPARVRALGDGRRWVPPAAEVRVPRPARRPGGVLLDWGRPVEGHLALRLDSRQGLRTALVFFGERPFDPLAGVPAAAAGSDALLEGDGALAAGAVDGTLAGGALDGAAGDGDGGRAVPDAAVIVIPGRPGWTDAVARRFRYAAVLGATPVVEAWVDPPAAWETARAPVDGRREGLLGIAPPPLRAPVEDEVRRQLQGLARRARR